MDELMFLEEAHFQFPLSAFVAPPDPEDEDDDGDDERRETLDAVILAALVSP